MQEGYQLFSAASKATEWATPTRSMSCAWLAMASSLARWARSLLCGHHQLRSCPPRLLHTIQSAHLAEWNDQYIPIEKHNRIESLRLCRGSDFALNRQVVHELRHLRLSEFPWIMFAVEENELPSPEPIGFFCAWTEMATSTDCMNLIHQAQCGGDGIVLRGLAIRTP